MAFDGRVPGLLHPLEHFSHPSQDYQPVLSTLPSMLSSRRSVSVSMLHESGYITVMTTAEEV